MNDLEEHKLEEVLRNLKETLDPHHIIIGEQAFKYDPVYIVAFSGGKIEKANLLTTYSQTTRDLEHNVYQLFTNLTMFLSKIQRTLEEFDESL